MIPTTLEMEVAIASYFGVRQNIIVPNLHWGFFIHECDLFIIRPSWYAIEVEIKRTVADLKNESKKKHKHQDNRVKELYFAVPLDIYEKCIDYIPKHAGIITVNKKRNGYCYAEIKRKPTINTLSRKLTIKELLAVSRLGVMRVWNLKKKLAKRDDLNMLL